MEVKKVQSSKLKVKSCEIRDLSDLKHVLYDKKWAKTTPNFELYYIYRGVKQKGEIRYDITVIPPRMLGQEFVKTKGHEHSREYQEVYIVLEGETIFLLQKCKGKLVKDVYAVKAKKGDVVIIPSHYGHITINPSKKEAKIANWLNKKCQNIYNLFEELRGACYYYTKRGWLKNKNYKKIPKLRFEKPLKKMPRSLAFLKG